MYYTALKGKSVVNTVTGASLGHITDLVIDDSRGNIMAICVPMPDGGFLSRARRDSSLAIPWHCIEKIGDDVILARVETFVRADGRTNTKNGESL